MPSKNGSNYEFLRDKWIKKHKDLQASLVKKHKDSFEWLSNSTKQLTLGSLAGLTILTAPIASGNIGPQVKVASEEAQRVNTNAFVVADLTPLVPQEMRPLSSEEEASIGKALSKSFGLKVTTQMNGLRLNRSYGLIGAEQHLARYPGDNMATHFDGSEEDAANYYSSGMAPGLGAWGYFTTSQPAMTQEDIDREKYYIAVQTFLSPDFNQKVAEYRDFYKYRKMLIVNPQNGKAMVVDIADAGPAEWTGKHLGGSPEVMKYLERQDGRARGPVLYYFIEDAGNIPLGPIQPV